MPISRRGFLGCLAGLVAAPMIVKVDSIMPVKKVRWGEYTLNDMPFSIEKIAVIAQSRQLSANYTLEMAEAYPAQWSRTLEDELSAMFQEEINKEILNTIKQNRNPFLDIESYPPGSVFSTRPAITDPLAKFRLCQSTPGSGDVLAALGKMPIRA